MIHKLLNYFGLASERNEQTWDEEAYEYENEYSPEETGSVQPPVAKPNVVPLQSVKKEHKVILEEPRSYDESQSIADHLRNQGVVVVNLQRMNHDQAKRVVDFLSGTVYAVEGNIHKIGPNIFICTPEFVEVEGAITDMANEEYQSRMR